MELSQIHVQIVQPVFIVKRKLVQVSKSGSEMKENVDVSKSIKTAHFTVIMEFMYGTMLTANANAISLMIRLSVRLMSISTIQAVAVCVMLVTENVFIHWCGIH